MKLIIINGTTGVGKSTVAEMLHKELPLSFLLDIDAQRRFISEYKDNRKKSGELSFIVSRAIVEAYLNIGYDVIIDKIIVNTKTTLKKFIELGDKYEAETYEFILNASKETVIKRLNDRGYGPGGLLTPEKAERWWHETQKYIKENPNTVVINTDGLIPEEVFQKVKEYIFS